MTLALKVMEYVMEKKTYDFFEFLFLYLYQNI